ncbi:MAG TPA: DUF3088 domain-containing protein [Caulobacterales bacterium]|nr:DUF3088 domain-containing protein [Caulobacterales bacterium]
MQRDVLFMIEAPFEDVKYPGQKWFCRDCMTLDGALALNPHWRECVDIHHVRYQKPREEVIALLGVDNQSCPVLVIADPSAAPEGAKTHEGRAFLTEPKAILNHLWKSYGGVGQHP